MACCSEKQNECLKVITIAYLKSFIKDSYGNLLIQNSNGASVDVNLNALAAANRRDDYCPTYGELTGGSLIQLGRRASSPNGDVDGIVVNSVYTGGGSSVSYKTNQEVNQKDLSLIYTRFASFSISASKTSVSECGDSSNICYSHSYTRYSKQMNGSCNITSGSTATTDTTDSEVTLTTSSFGSFGNWSSHCKALSIPKNGTIQSPSRSTTVTGRIVFRNSTKTSSVTITQAALTGSWNLHHRIKNNFYLVSSNKPDTFEDCDAGVMNYYGVLEYTEYYEWLDSCGKHYTQAEKAYDVRPKTDYIKNGGNDYTITYIATEKDCEYDLVSTKTATLSTQFNPVTAATQTFSASKTFTITCTHDPDQPKCCDDYPEYVSSEPCNYSSYGTYVKTYWRYYKQRKVNGVCQVTDWSNYTTGYTESKCCVTCEDDRKESWNPYSCTGHEGKRIRITGTATITPKYPNPACKECVEGTTYTEPISDYVTCPCKQFTDNCKEGVPIHHDSSGDYSGGERLDATGITVAGTTGGISATIGSDNVLRYTFPSSPNTSSYSKTVGYIYLSHPGTNGYCTSCSLAIEQCPKDHNYDHNKHKCVKK